MKTTVIYHRADFDGLFCREIARKFLPDAELIGWDYGDPVLDFPYDGTVYVLDLSPDCFKQLQLGGPQMKRLIWIDHHKTAIEKHAQFTIAGYRIDGVAACRLAWQWFKAYCTDKDSCTYSDCPTAFCDYGKLPDKEAFFNHTVTEPYAVRLAGEYDIWDKRDPNAELFQHGLKSRELSERDWSMLLDPSVDKALQGTRMEYTNSELFSKTLLDDGRTVAYVREQEYKEVILEQGFDVEFEGLKYLACCSHELDIRSQLFEAGIKPEHDGLLGFTFTGKDWRVSLYAVPTKRHIDHSVNAKKYGGGGHAGACGFRVKELPFKL